MKRHPVSALFVALCALLSQPSAAHASKHVAHPHHAPAHRGEPAALKQHESPAKPQPHEQVEEIEQIEQIEPVVPEADPKAQQPAQAAGSTGFSAMIEPEAMSASVIALLGHLHPAAVHLPIAWTLLWAAVEVLGPPLGLAPLAAAALPLGFATVISFFPSVVSGLSRLTELSSAAQGGGYEATLALTHRNLMFVAWAILAGALVLRMLWARWPLRAIRRAYVLALVVATLIVLYSAHLGGRLVYGDDFLPFPF